MAGLRSDHSRNVAAVISMTLRITANGETTDVQVGPKVQVAFEREWKIGMPRAFGDQQRFEYVYWIAWKALHVAGNVVKPFDGWLETVENVEMVEAGTGPLSETG